MIFVGGLLGSSHCIGMCGAFALALGSRHSRMAANVFRQVIYSLGRVFTYSMAGAAAGYAGWRLMAEMNTMVNIQAILSVTAGVLLTVQGLISAGVLPGFAWSSGSSSCLGPKLFSGLLGAARLRSVFLGGVVNGLLPCGLVYAFLTLAASSGDMLQGWATMALFGLGTLPVMVLVGSGGTLLGLAGRRRLLHLAAWCVVLTGLLSVGRGIAFMQAAGTVEAACPLCH
jgi:sulfite exporter TauE/SafE